MDTIIYLFIYLFLNGNGKAKAPNDVWRLKKIDVSTDIFAFKLLLEINEHLFQLSTRGTSSVAVTSVYIQFQILPVNMSTN